MAVWLLLLRTTALHSRILHSDDLRDAQPQEWQHSESPQWAPQAGNFLREFKWLHNGSPNSVQYMALPPISPWHKRRHLLSNGWIKSLVCLCREGRLPKLSSASFSSLPSAGSRCTSAGSSSGPFTPRKIPRAVSSSSKFTGRATLSCNRSYIKVQ